MTKVFHYPWRAAIKPAHWRLPSPSGDIVSPEVGAFVDHGNGTFEEIPGPTIREGTGQNRVQIKDVGQFLYSSEYSHQFQKETTDSSVRRCHFALTDAFIWLSGYLYRHREDSGSPLAERKLSEACAAFREYLGSQKDFAPESLIVEIARNAPEAISSIVAGPHMVLMREHTEVPLDKIQEMDTFSLVALARRPGRTVAMKAGTKQRLTALTLRETADTVENRVVMDFILRSARSARQYVDEMCARCPRKEACKLHDPVVEKDCPSERVKIVASYSRHCAAWLRNGTFAEVARLKEPRTRPNYVLQQNIRYVKVWKYYLKLLSLEDVEEDVWRWRRAAWSDMAKMLFLMVWEERLKPRAKLQTSRRPFMIRSANRNGRWLVPTPFEDSLVFGERGRYKTLYILSPHDAAKLTDERGLLAKNADFFIVVAAEGKFAVRPVWAFCGDAKTQSELDANRLAKESSAEIDSAGMSGLALFPSDENVVAWTGESCAQGLDIFSSDSVCDRLEDYLKGVLS